MKYRAIYLGIKGEASYKGFKLLISLVPTYLPTYLPNYLSVRPSIYLYLPVYKGVI